MRKKVESALIALAILLLMQFQGAGCKKHLNGDTEDSPPLFNQVTLPIPADGLISDISYLPDEQIFLVGDYGNGKTWLFNPVGELVGESNDRLLATSTSNGMKLAYFTGQPCINRIEVEGDGLILTPTNWRGNTSFTLLPTGHIVSYEIDLADQLQEIERKVGIILQAIKKGVVIDDTLIGELINADNAMEKDIDSEFNQWARLVEICDEHYGEGIGIAELSPAIKTDCLKTVKIFDENSKLVGEALEPPTLDGAGYSSLRVFGCSYNSHIYVANTIEPVLHVLRYDMPRIGSSAITPVSQLSFQEHLNDIPNAIFEYRRPSEEVRNRYPHLSFPFTPAWGVYSLMDGTIVVRVMDQVTKKSALILFQDGECRCVSVTGWTPMSSNGNTLVLMNSDSVNNQIQLKVFRDNSDLVHFLAGEADYCVQIPSLSAPFPAGK